MIGDDFGKEIAVGTVPVEVRRNGVGEHAGVTNPQTAESNQQRDRHGDGQVDGESVAEALDTNFASKFAKAETEERGKRLDNENIDGCVRPRIHRLNFSESTTTKTGQIKV